MAARKETNEVEIRLNTEQANTKIKELEKEVRSLEKSLDQMGKGDKAARQETIEKLQQTEAEILKLRESVKSDMRVVINGDVRKKPT